ncbi:MAG: hypothetical protein LBU67_07950, partial [Oscillospiraceae bacterium]|nr:hypothetical protein [Oscillospiraceae bacterium]
MSKLVWKDKRVLVVGMARSGVAAAKALAAQGALPVLSDSKPRDQFNGKLDELDAVPCEWRLAEPPESLLNGCDAV